jgi:NAD(P)-dependent dehydrogenase (short-subunit alcohol dehydrogenase family)
MYYANEENAMKMLKDKVAIVTGGGSGIGRAVAISYAKEGAKVVVSDIDDAGGKATVDMIWKDGGEAMYVHADVALAADNEMLVKKTVDAYGALHIACNNAGIGGPAAPTGEYPLDGWEKVIGINLNGVFYGLRYQIPEMLKVGGGAIVNIASILGQVGFAMSSAYVAAKHGVVGLSKNAAIEYADKGIRVNSVGPAFIKTPLLDKNLTPEVMDYLVTKHPIGRMGESEEVAELVLWLSSDKASFVTGSYYAVDGGYLSV